MRAVWGVCGIGRGHLVRQLPLIETVAATGAPVAVLTYGPATAELTRLLAPRPNVRVVPVAVPFWVGGPTGLDFAGTAARAAAGPDPLAVNATAMAAALAHVGTPDVVVSDYEPVSAQLSYALGTPLVTLDQQSKYLAGAFPATLGGVGYRDEVQRLSMLFPAAAARLACSFFTVPEAGTGRGASVEVIAPILRDQVRAITARQRDPRHALVYLTGSQAAQAPALAAVLDELVHVRTHRFTVFAPAAGLPAPGPAGAGTGGPPARALTVGGNVTVLAHGDPRFERSLRTASSIVSTAGHGLLSEAMALGVPVYAMPTAVYEQQMNAHVLDRHGFGVAHPCVQRDRLADFLASVPRYSAAIATDTTVLVRGDGRGRALSVIASLAHNGRG